MVLAAFLVVGVATRSDTPPKGASHSRTTTVPHGHARQADGSSPRPLGIGGDWKLILNQVFSGHHLDTAIWRTGWFGSGVTGPINKHESACYNEHNVSLTDRLLHLTVSHVRSFCSHQSRPFTGAVLSSNPRDGRAHGGFQYRYGLLEAKVFVPATPNSKIADWPGVIALGQVWPRDGEDDVMENLGGLVCSHFHSPGYAPGGNLGGCDPGFTPGWHVVSSVWEPGSASWYYDGIEVAHADHGITSAPMYLVLVNTVSNKALQVAMPDAMRVAYVRVWQRAR